MFSLSKSTSHDLFDVGFPCHGGVTVCSQAAVLWWQASLSMKSFLLTSRCMLVREWLAPQIMEGLTTHLYEHLAIKARLLNVIGMCVHFEVCIKVKILRTSVGLITKCFTHIILWNKNISKKEGLPGVGQIYCVDSNVRCSFLWLLKRNLCVFSIWFTETAAHYAITLPVNAAHRRRSEFYEITKPRKEMIT